MDNSIRQEPEEYEYDETLDTVESDNGKAVLEVIDPQTYKLKFFTTEDLVNHVVEWEIANPDAIGQTFNELRLAKKEKDGQGQFVELEIYEYVWSDVNNVQTWELTTSDGASNVLRRERKSETILISGNRLETYEVFNTAGTATVYKETNEYHDFAWKEELVQRVVDPENFEVGVFGAGRLRSGSITKRQGTSMVS